MPVPISWSQVPGRTAIVACLLLAALGVAGCGGNDDSSSTSQADQPPFSSESQRRLFEVAQKDQLALAQMAVLITPLDLCGKRALAGKTTLSSCETAAGLARVPGGNVSVLGPNAVSIPARSDPNVKIRVVFGAGPGQVQVSAARRGWTIVSHSQNGNVFTESKSPYGSKDRRNVRFTCTKPKRGFCPKTGNLLNPGTRRVPLRRKSPAS
jgi:hypothetical protein